MSEKREKKKFDLRNYVGMLFFLAIGGFSGWFIGYYLGETASDGGLGQTLWSFAVLLLGMLPNVFAAPTSNPFTDVKEDAFYYDAVLWAVDKGITTGLSATQFGPNAPCTRGQIVTFLWRAAGSPEPITKEMPFTDVKDGDFFFKAVAWAVEKNITTGLSATQFGANSPCTRGQIVTFLWRFAGEPKPESKTMPFADVKTSDFYFDAVLWAVEKNITTGLSATQFGPNSPCTRGQIVTFLYRNMSTAVVSEPLTILFQPSDFQLGDNLETVEFWGVELRK